MSREESFEVDTLEIADLEYDVGGMSAEEPGESRTSMQSVLIVTVPV